METNAIEDAKPRAATEKRDQSIFVSMFVFLPTGSSFSMTATQEGKGFNLEF